MATLSARALASLASGWRAGAGGPAYLALADRIRLLILDGRVSLGTRLPSERELAQHLELSRTTVSAAYASLRDAGYLDSIRGSGSVARLPRRAPEEFEHFNTELLDFSKATLPALPEVASAAERAVAQLPGYLHESGFDALGLRVLRQALADRYTGKGLPDRGRRDHDHGRRPARDRPARAHARLARRSRAHRVAELPARRRGPALQRRAAGARRRHDR